MPFLRSIEGRQEFKAVLNCLWSNRKQFGLTSVYFTEDISEQQFFTFYDNCIKANNYIGTIKFGENTVQILPKIFQHNPDKISEDQLLILVNSNLLWWLSKASKIKFPKSFTGWDSQSYNLIDIFIHLFASLTKDDLIYNKHQSYITQEESIQTLRGRIDFSKYAVNYYTGNAHVLPCIYDSLELDNLYNQIVKFTSKLLLHNTENPEIKKLLQEIIWVLDDVSDQFITCNDCDKVVVSPLNQNMKIILDYCRMFLSGMSVKTENDELEIFSFLIPTESLFQDFVFGFIIDEFGHDQNVRGIYSETNKDGKRVPLAKEVSVLGNEKYVFGLKPDIYI
jgi:5-methylcytosine-specific restriction enzyme subunit McrC